MGKTMEMLAPSCLKEGSASPGHPHHLCTSSNQCKMHCKQMQCNVSKMAFPLILGPASHVTKPKAISTESSSQLEVKSL